MVVMTHSNNLFNAHKSSKKSLQVKETGKTVVSNGYMLLHGKTGKGQAKFTSFKDKMDIRLAKKDKDAPFDFEYASRDAIVYALGVGCNAKEDLCYVYEGADGFMPLPTFIVAPGTRANRLKDCPGLNIGMQPLLHGDQYIELYEPLPAEGSFRSERRFVDVGAGNFGSHEKKGAEIPKRPADKIIVEQTSEDQAALYRVGSGDMSLLHIDPRNSGFNAPILHGLCTMRFAARHVIKVFANNDATSFKAIKVRFTSPVIPGQTLETHMWDEGDRKNIFAPIVLILAAVAAIASAGDGGFSGFGRSHLRIFHFYSSFHGSLSYILISIYLQHFFRDLFTDTVQLCLEIFLRKAMDVQLAQQHKPDPVDFEYTTRDAIIYALGGLKVDMQRILHGEQYIEMFAPLPAESHLRIFHFYSSFHGSLSYILISIYLQHFFRDLFTDTVQLCLEIFLRKAMDVQLAQQHKPDPVDFEYTTRDAIIYALGVGCKAKEDIRYLYEGAEGFMPLPTYIVAPGMKSTGLTRWPGLKVDMQRILHGEQYIEMFAPLPAEMQHQ
uniref:MaoC-like domain-containing protein n=1 Tax=Pristionchus pacificus TaxID=54126 RepID=A0A8R1U828_PRIPA